MEDEVISDEDLVGALEDIEEGLNEWELNFVDSISKWWASNKFLTTGQRRKAAQVWKERDEGENKNPLCLCLWMFLFGDACCL